MRQERHVWRWLLMLALLVVLAGWLWPGERREPPPPPAAAAPVRIAAHAPKRAPPPVAHRSPPEAIDRAALLAALKDKAKELARCPVPPGQLPELPARLRITPRGSIDRVQWAGTPPSPSLARCYREVILHWKLEGVRVPRPTTVLVSLELDAR